MLHARSRGKPAAQEFEELDHPASARPQYILWARHRGTAGSLVPSLPIFALAVFVPGIVIRNACIGSVTQGRPPTALAGGFWLFALMVLLVILLPLHSV
jgi:hypothetical protein